MKANSKYKDSVFSTLFKDPDRLRELYCALVGVDLPPSVPIVVNTLQNVLFVGLVNDISFFVDNKLVVLFEHQSTVNPNMTIRMLLYLAKLYAKITEGPKLYGSALVKIPRPEFWVLYNGAAPYPSRQTLRLSDSFEEAASLGLPEKTALELEVEVVNINEGQNADIARRCKTLAQYSAFIDKVRTLTKEMGNLEEAITAAIKYCREHDILKEFLEKHATEVLEMMLEECTMEDVIAFEKEESLKKGLERGLEQERRQNIRRFFAFGMTPEQIAQALELPLGAVLRYLAE
jgi:predicted transposase/invertase (TIGR01784 family)